MLDGVADGLLRHPVKTQSALSLQGVRIRIDVEPERDLALPFSLDHPDKLIQRSRDNPAREEVYELLGSRGEMSMDECTRRDLFWKGIVFYREQKWDDALTNFKLARELYPEDAPAEFYIRRVEQLRNGVATLDWSKA